VAMGFRGGRAGALWMSKNSMELLSALVSRGGSPANHFCRRCGASQLPKPEVMDITGQLRKSTRNRWEIVDEEGHVCELSSGSVCELQIGSRWVRARLEFYADAGGTGHYFEVEKEIAAAGSRMAIRRWQERAVHERGRSDRPKCVEWAPEKCARA
jgi:hypothetical protein